MDRYLSAIRLSGIRVLVADGDAHYAEALAELLTMRGAVVRTAANGYEALEVTASWTPEVMLLDIEMPYMDGYELVRKFRRDTSTAFAYILAMTAHAGAGRRECALAVGFDEHITKP